MAGFTRLFSYLVCGLLVMTMITPSSTVIAQLEKRIHHHHAGRAHQHRSAHQVHNSGGDVNLWGHPRDKLAFDAAFNEITSFPNVHFSAAQFFHRLPRQKTEEFWTPSDVNTELAPAKYFFEACLNTTGAGRKWQAAARGEIDVDFQVYLVNLWGTFENKYGVFKPWQWKEDGIMAVSCQYMKIAHADIGEKMSIDKFKLLDESSSEMIKNMRKEHFDVWQVAGPSLTRHDLEVQIVKNKKTNN